MKSFKYNRKKPMVVQVRVATIQGKEFYREMKITEFLRRNDVDLNTKKFLADSYNQALEKMKIKLDF